MANLGELSYELNIKDNTEQQLKNIRKTIESELKNGMKVTAEVDASRLRDSVKSALRKTTVGDIQLDINRNALQKNVNEAIQGLKNNTKMEIGIQANASEATKAIKEALKAGEPYTVNVVVNATQIQGNMNDLVKQLTTNNEKLNQTHARGTEAVNRHAESYAKLHASMNGVVGVSTSLKGSLEGVFTIYAAQQFLSNVIEIGGELENIKLSMEGILQDRGQAADLMQQMKSLSLQSPYGIMDLNSYAKKLTAFNVPYNELYDTTKRLGDIASGVGTDMGRLINAFGKVKTSRFLNGMELRMFNNNNIPILQKLSEKYSELEGRVVSAGEVMERVSKKMVTFEDVKDVLWEMTNSDGMFYEHQEILAESLKSKWKILHDSIDLMFGELGNSGLGSFLKVVAEDLTALTKHYDDFGTVLASIAGTFGVAKLATLTYSAAMGKTLTSNLQVAQSELRKRAAILQSAASYRELTVAEKQTYAAGISSLGAYFPMIFKINAAQMQELITSKAITKEMALRAIALGRVDAEAMKLLVTQKILTQAEIAGVKATGMFSMALTQLGSSLSAALTAYGPLIASMVVIGGIFEWIHASHEDAQAAADKDVESTKAATDAYKNMGETLKKYSEYSTSDVYTNGKKTGTRTTLEPKELASDSAYVTAISDIVNDIKDYVPEADDMLQGLFDENGKAVNNLHDTYVKLVNILKQVKDAQPHLEHTDSFITSIQDDTDYKDTFEDASDEWKEFEKNIKNTIGSSTKFRDIMGEIMSKEKEFASFIRERGAENDLAKQYELLFLKARNFRSAYNRLLDLEQKNFNGNVPYIGTADVSMRLSNASVEAKKIFENIKSAARVEFPHIDFKKLTDEQKVYVETLWKNAKFTIPGLATGVQDELDAVFGQTFNINVLAHVQIADQKEGWKDEIGNILGTGFTEELNKSISMNALNDLLRKRKKEIKDAITEEEKQLGSNKGLTTQPNMGLEKTAQELESNKELLSEINEYEKKYNINLDKEQKKTNRSQKDTWLEQWKNRLQLLEKFYAEYEKWQKLEGSAAAKSRLKSSKAFAPLFAYFGKNLDPANKRGGLSAMLADITKNANGKEARLKEKNNLGVKIELDIRREEVERATKQLITEFDAAIKKEGQKWSVFQTLFDATGDKDTAMRLAFREDNIEKGASLYLDHLREVFAKISKGFTYDDVLNMDDKKRADIFGSEDKVHEVVKYAELVQSETENVRKKQWSTYTQSLKETATYYDKIALIQKEYAEKIRVANLNDPSGVTARRLGAERDSKISALDPSNAKFLSNVLSLTKSEALAVGTAMKNNLVKQFEAGAISAEEMYRQIKNVDELIHKSNTRQSDFVAFASGGYSGVLQNRYDQTSANIQGLYSDQKQAIDERDTIEKQMSTMEEGSREYEILADELDVINGILPQIAEKLGIETKKQQKTQSQIDAEKNLNAVISNGQKGVSAANFVQSNVAKIWGSKSGAAQSLSSMTEVGGSMLQGASLGASIGGPWGAAIGAAIGAVGAIAGLHDKTLQKEIEASQQREKEMSNLTDRLKDALNDSLSKLYSNGITDDIKGQLSAMIGYENLRKTTDNVALKNLMKQRYSDDTIAQTERALKTQSNYDAQLALYMGQRDELQNQLDAENKKKDTDDSKVSDYEQQIYELEEDIKNFAKDMMETLYSIDFDSWANDLASTLVDAWAAGTDAAEAYRDKVGELLKEVATNMIAQSIIGKVLEPLVDKFTTHFTEKSGVMDDELYDELGQIFKATETVDDWVTKALDSYEAILNKYNYSLKDSDSSSLSAGIQEVTEDTAALLASYINSMRADLSIQRTYVQLIYEEAMPEITLIAQSQLNQLSNIAENTSNNLEAVERIENMLNRSVSGVAPLIQL